MVTADVVGEEEELVEEGEGEWCGAGVVGLFYEEELREEAQVQGEAGEGVDDGLGQEEEEEELAAEQGDCL